MIQTKLTSLTYQLHMAQVLTPSGDIQIMKYTNLDQSFAGTEASSEVPPVDRGEKESICDSPSKFSTLPPTCIRLLRESYLSFN